MTIYDVVIVGGGPAGLSAALALGRARRRVLVCDGGPRRNAAAEHVHNLFTRDGTPPDELRRIARAQLAPYPVEVRDVRIADIGGERGRFEVRLETGDRVISRRVLLATGMIDVLPDIEGFRDLWGTSIILCPYCHGWEVQDRRFAYLAPGAELLEFGIFLRGWTRDVVVLTGGRFAVPDEVRPRLAAAGVALDERPIARLVARGGRLASIELADGGALPVEILFAKLPQRQVPLVERLGLALDAMGYVEVHPVHRETSIPGIFAGGDLVTPMQGAVLAAASGVQAAAMLNHGLVTELVLAGALP